MISDREQIRALVSGISGIENRNQRMFMVFQAFVDESEGGTEIFVLGGYITTVKRWEHFTDEWRELLNHYHLTEFKMSEQWRRHEMCREFYRIIVKNVMASVACSIDRTALTQIVEAIPRPDVSDWSIDDKRKMNKAFKVYRNPYHLCAKPLFIDVLRHQERAGIDQPIDYIFDERKEAKDLAEGWDYLRWCFNDEMRDKLGERPVFRNSVKFLPLQAADMYAWCVRKAELENGWKANSYFNEDEPIKEMFIQMGADQILEQIKFVLSPEIKAQDEEYIKASKSV